MVRNKRSFQERSESMKETLKHPENPSLSKTENRFGLQRLSTLKKNQIVSKEHFDSFNMRELENIQEHLTDSDQLLNVSMLINRNLSIFDYKVFFAISKCFSLIIR